MAELAQHDTPAPDAPSLQQQQQHQEDEDYTYESGDEDQSCVPCGPPDPSSGMAICGTCGVRVPLRTLDLHTAYCEKNNCRCDVCGKVMRKVDLPKHRLETHAKVSCECGLVLEVSKMAAHHAPGGGCRYRTTAMCQYCDLPYSLLEMEEHQRFCGSRTDICNNCGSRVLLRDWASHVLSGCAAETTRC